jgi:hypothetical protein
MTKVVVAAALGERVHRRPGLPGPAPGGSRDRPAIKIPFAWIRGCHHLWTCQGWKPALQPQ